MLILSNVFELKIIITLLFHFYSYSNCWNILAIISTAIILDEVIGANVLEDNFVNVNVNTYDKKCKLITE